MTNQHEQEDASIDEVEKVIAEGQVAGAKVGQEGAEKQGASRVFPQDYIAIDKHGAFRDITSLPDHIREGYNLAVGVRTERPFAHVVIAGMGGSGIAGAFVKTLCDYHEECSVPIETTRGYEAPKSVTEKTLLIAISYSGNTEETLSTYKTALRKQCQAITISSGGKLQELAKLNNHPHIKLPANLQPRMAMGLLLFSTLRILENAGVIRHLEEDVKEIVDTLKRAGLSQKAVELSEKCYEKIPLIYADSTFYPVAYRWRTQFNENAKTVALSHELSEFNHNEILAFANRNASFHAFFLSTDKQHRRISKRIELTKAVLQTKGVPVTEIASKGTMLKQMMTAMYLGDLTSYFLALRYETDPTPVKLIEQFKKDLGPFLI